VSRILLLVAAAVAAGVVNSLAGGGTLLTFPALLSVGVGPVAANATSTVALVTGSFSAAWGFRAELPTERRLLQTILLPSLLGGFVGAWVVAHVSDALFARLVPWLILGATLLFMVQEPLRRWTSGRGASADGPPAPSIGKLAVAQFLIAIYGGFFGAGMGIMLLATLGLVGLRDIHQMNGVKNLSAVAVNGVASVTFAAAHKVQWTLALVMALGAILGGYSGAALGRWVGPLWVRRFVVAVGLGIGGYLLFRR
jgi:uncharacterized membrane protein YfcA